MDYDLDNRIIKVDVDNNDVEKYRRLVGILDLESEANVARRVSSREADANQYRYDALGRRVIRQEGTTKTALIWWGDSEKHRRLVGVLDRMSGASEARRVKAREASLNQCAEHKHQAGQTVIQNDIMAHPSRLNSVIARAVDGSKFKLEWYHKNYLDHVYAVSDDDGDILEHYRYTAFGEVSIYNSNGNQVATTQIDNHILWNTRRRDALTGYYMYKFRHYSAELGRWLARDPIEERGGVNLYGFVGNEPVGRWDRLGLAISHTESGSSSTWTPDDNNPSYENELCCYPISKGAKSKYKVKEGDILYTSVTVKGSCCDQSDIYWLGDQCSGDLDVYLNFIGIFAAPKKDPLSEDVAKGRASVSIAKGTIKNNAGGENLSIVNTGGVTSARYYKNVGSLNCSGGNLKGAYSIYLFDTFTNPSGKWTSLYTISYDITTESCGEISVNALKIEEFGNVWKPGREIVQTYYENEAFDNF